MIPALVWRRTPSLSGFISLYYSADFVVSKVDCYLNSNLCCLAYFVTRSSVSDCFEACWTLAYSTCSSSQYFVGFGVHGFYFQKLLAFEG